MYFKNTILLHKYLIYVLCRYTAHILNLRRVWIYGIIRFSLHSFSDQQLCVLCPNWRKQRNHQHFDIFPQTRRPWQTFGMPSFCRGDSWLYCRRFKTITYSLWVSFSALDVRVVNFQKIYYYLKTNRETNLISGSLKKIIEGCPGSIVEEDSRWLHIFCEFLFLT